MHIKTPSYFTSTGAQPAFGDGTCVSAGFAAGTPGYAQVTAFTIYDQDGVAVGPIPVNETFDNFVSLRSNNYVSLLSSPSSWAANRFTGNAFNDYYIACSAALSPPVTSLNKGNSLAVINYTQKFFVGSLVHYSGTCTQEAVITEYNDHTALSGVLTPVPTQAQCAQGKSIN